MTTVISFGYRCSSASFIKLLNLKTESYPFDWMITKLATIKKCIETDFKDFCNIENYKYEKTETYNLIDGVKRHLGFENVLVNTLYETNPNNKQTYNYQLGFNHQNIEKDSEYYQRCISRFNKLLESDVKKIYIYFHPLLGPNDFNISYTKLLDDINTFNSYIQTKTKNGFGLYFIFVITDNTKTALRVNSDMLDSSENHAVFIIYCNKDFIDGGNPFAGNYVFEKEEIKRIIKYYVP